MVKVVLNIRVEQSEMEILEKYAKDSGRTKTDIIREYIRNLAIPFQGSKLRRPPHSLNE
ncbi:MAG: ribbon-helix-helix domain-containing protein [Trichormus sp.]|jgi:predicted DNA-binding protein